ncbi:hypothetical protein O3P69_012304 [Scylla paramamosain]|uniref:Reverse transcriptase/retrotransposon-derived protein RNase H-like domain-containing protein n=1 Tax=Scylla paramamosain TaxID=85552 RepID=A0AAW0TDH6_SCYPA
MIGYANNSAATSSMIDAEGWVHTGDYGYYDSQGLIYLTDRIKDLIKTKSSFQVQPSELEDLLLQHPHVAEVVDCNFLRSQSLSSSEKPRPTPYTTILRQLAHQSSLGSLPVGAVLQQTSKGDVSPIGFYSKRHHAAQIKYAAFDRELLAIYIAVQHLKHLLKDTYTPRVQRQLSYISEFTTDICHIRGVENPVADALLRSITAMTQYPPPLEYQQITIAQETDDDLAEFRRNPMSLELHPFQVSGTSLQVWCDVLGRVILESKPRDDSTRSVVWPQIRSWTSNVSPVRHQKFIVM